MMLHDVGIDLSSIPVSAAERLTNQNMNITLQSLLELSSLVQHSANVNFVNQLYSPSGHLDTLCSLTGIC